MKKLFSLVAVLMCMVMLSTTAFAATTADVLSVYRKYVKQSADIKSMDISVSQKISMSDGTDTVDVLRQDVAMKMRILDDDKLQLEARTVDAATKEISYAYFRNDWLYQQVGDQKFKIRMSMNEALASTANVDVNLTADMLKDATVQTLADGIKITYKTNLNDIADGEGHSIASMINEMNLPDDMKMEISTITSSVTIGYDGMMKAGSNSFGMRVHSGDITLNFKIVQTLKVNSVNTVDFIKFPADIGSYQTLTI